MTRPVQPHDTADATRLYTYLVEQEQERVKLHKRISFLESQYNKPVVVDSQTAGRVADALSASGSAPLSIDGLSGVAQLPQNPNLPTLSALPKPNNTNYTMVVVQIGAVRTLYTLNMSKRPYKWDKVGVLSAP